MENQERKLGVFPFAQTSSTSSFQFEFRCLPYAIFTLIMGICNCRKISKTFVKQFKTWFEVKEALLDNLYFVVSIIIAYDI